MCTVTWLQSANSYQLVCNRDERSTRQPATAPLVQNRQGVEFIAPLDGNHGGSWISVNQFKVAFCLLNRYVGVDRFQDIPKGYRSRGLFLLDLVDSHSLAEAQRRATSLCLEELQPFTLIGLEIGTPAVVWDWTGSDLLLQSSIQGALPMVSSSFDQSGVEIIRRHLFDQMITERGQVDSKLLHAFHASHLPFRGAYSPCMHREDASTVSHSCIKVDAECIEFSYFPGAPCEQSEAFQETTAESMLKTLILPSVKDMDDGPMNSERSQNWKRQMR